MAYRLTGSSDLYQTDGRRPYASINFVVAHDGFSLADTVSYEEKHNLDNGEENRDGHNDNLSRNYGVEGPTDNPEIEQLRIRQIKNLLTVTAISLGVPMMRDAVRSRTSHGNSGRYRQPQQRDSSRTSVGTTTSPTPIPARSAPQKPAAITIPGRGK